jgi:hypothetical protein
MGAIVRDLRRRPGLWANIHPGGQANLSPEAFDALGGPAWVRLSYDPEGRTIVVRGAASGELGARKVSRAGYCRMISVLGLLSSYGARIASPRHCEVGMLDGALQVHLDRDAPPREVAEDTFPADPATPTKRCTKCGVEKPISEFSPVKGGRYGVRGDCKRCVRQMSAAARQADPEPFREHSRQFRRRRREVREQTPKPVRTDKRCPKCSVTKPLGDFHTRRGGSQPGSYCKSCDRVRLRALRERRRRDDPQGEK